MKDSKIVNQSFIIPYLLYILMEMVSLSKESCEFYKYWRENYKWPLNKSREKSENKISQLLKQANDALNDFTINIKSILYVIHYWKTQNRSKITDKYMQNLNTKPEFIPDLKELFPVPYPITSPYIMTLLNKLKIKFCNLPVCTAQASFLCNRKIPILDRFVAQFFSKTIFPNVLKHTQFNMTEILQSFSPVQFIIEDDGRHKCTPRLAVYQNSRYKKNRDLFVYHLLPVLSNITNHLNDQQVSYLDLNNNPRKFNSVDVEMAVFAFGTQNRKYFQCWYEKRPSALRI